MIGRPVADFERPTTQLLLPSGASSSIAANCPGSTVTEACAAFAADLVTRTPWVASWNTFSL